MMKCRKSHLILSSKDLKQARRILIRDIVQSKLKFDCIVFKGYSGALLASFIAMQFNKPLILIRKNQDSNYAPEGIEVDNSFNLEKAKYIIIDDFIATGQTVLEIWKILKKYNCRCLGCFLYNSCGTPINDRKRIEKKMGKIPIVCCRKCKRVSRPKCKRLK